MGLITESWKTDLLYCAIGLITLFYLMEKYLYSYWKRKGFKTHSGINVLFGHFKLMFLQRESFGDFMKRIYDETTEPFIGIYGVYRPILLVRDPELIRSILVKDFSSFADRGVHCREDYDPLTGNLFALTGEKWKSLRGKLSPTFTSGRLKSMFSTLVDCGSSLQKYLKMAAELNQTIDIRELSASYATNVIASVAFGIEVDTIADPHNDFRKYGKQHMAVTMKNGFRNVLSMIAPKLMGLLHVRFVDQEIEDFIRSMVEQNLEYREKNNVVRKDFFQLLVQLRNNGTVQLDDEWETEIKGDENQKSLTINEMCAQVFIFYVAGFETSSNTLSWCLYELANNPDIQKRVQCEIDTVLANHDGKITYESISDMRYLDCCIDETSRKYSIVPFLNRTCVKDYQIPGTQNIIEKGVEVFIPNYALHRDEKYYHEPNKFKPERFNKECSTGKNQINRPLLPFGDGPRNCIGMRMGKLQTKVGLVLMLQKYRYELEEHLVNKELSYDPKSFLIAPMDGIINLGIIKRK